MGIQIKKFQAPTLQKAIEQVRIEMGDNAIILQTEPVRGNKALGLFGRDLVEVTAAIDRKELAPRFHATVTEKDAEREMVEVDNEKPNWKNLLGFNKKKQTSYVKHLPLDEERKLQHQKSLAAYKAAAAPAQTTTTTTTSDEGTKPAVSASQIYAMKTFIEPLQKEIETLKAKTAQPQGATAGKRKVKDPLEIEVQLLRSQLSAFINEKRFEGQKLPHYFKQIMDFWTEKGMSNKQILRFFKAMEDWGTEFEPSTPLLQASKALVTALDGSINQANVYEKRERRIVVLVGPTGVGKTTTIAKMAAHEKLNLKRTVSLLTLDDYKIGGTDQLNHYARILEVNFTKSRSDISLEEQCKLQTADTIFVDTFGVASTDTLRLEILKKNLQFRDPELKKQVEVHLVLPTGISQTDVHEQLTEFSSLNPSFLIFTKWDETKNWGGMLSTILESRKPVSFICNGQNVPDDITLFDKKNFIETITEVYTD